MPSYPNNPFVPPLTVMKGVACYLYGSYNYRQDHTRMLVSNVALTTNVATLTVQIVAGEIPVIGALISVQQTANTAGLFNVNRVALTGVTINSATGAGTVTFALTHANVGAAADTGSAVVEVPEVPETLANGKSIACVIPAPEGDSQFTVAVAVSFPTIPTAVTVDLQRAIHESDAEYTTVGTTHAAVVAASAQTVGPVTEWTLERGYFYRLIVSGLSGAGTIVAKIGG